MALSRPHIVVNSTRASSDAITVFLQLESDKGPTGDVVLVSSIEEFLISYQSESKSDSYNLAIFLLQLGYRLYIQRVNTSTGVQSVRLLNGNTIKSLSDTLNYAFPKKDTDYTHNSVAEGNLIGNTFSYTFVIDREILNSDYMLVHTGLSWNLIYFSRTSAPLPANTYSKAYYCSGTMDSLKDILEGNLGMKTEISGNSITIYAYHRFMTPVTSFTNSFTSEELNNDVYCYLTNEYKVLDVYSKYNGSTNDLVLSVNRTMDLYQLKFQLVSPVTLVPIYEEYYSVPTEEEGLYEAVININMTSKLFELEYYGGYLPSGAVRLRRGCTTSTPNEDSYITAITNKALDDNYPDIVLEATINSQDYHDSVINEVRSKSTPTIILSQYNKDYNYKDRFLINFFDADIEINTTKYPAYTYLLMLLSRATDEGSYPNINVIPSELVAYSLEVNVPTMNDYGVSELANPVGYLSTDSQVPSGLLIAYSIAINRLMSGLDLVQVSESYLMNKLNNAVSTAMKLTGTTLEMSISNYSVNNRLLKFTVNVNLVYELSKQFDLIISISRSS